MKEVKEVSTSQPLLGEGANHAPGDAPRRDHSFTSRTSITSFTLESAPVQTRSYCPAKSFDTLKHFSFSMSSSLFHDSRNAVTPSVSSSWRD